MAFVLTEEQEMIQTMAHDFAREVVMPQAAERDRTHVFPRDILNQMGELGFMGMMAPEEYGGVGLDTVSYVLALTEIAYACASTAVVMSVHNSICVETLLRFASPEQKKTWLPRMCSGECIGAFALTEPHAGSDPASQRTTARLDGDEYVINGTKQFITTGKNAGLIIVTALTNKTKRHRGISAFLVPQGTPGLIVGKTEEKLGLKASDTVQLIFEDCRIPKENLLGKRVGEGFKVAMSGLDCGRIGIAAQSVGVAQACMDEAIAYMHGREQFGRSISQFQGLRWKIADMATEIEAARVLCLNAASLKDQGRRYTKEASMAKLFASEMVNRVAGQAIQIHGGYGYCSEYPMERHYRDARVFTIYEGTSEIQRVVVSNILLGPPEKR
ncbi:acyl-CoA dehydrogenase [Dethiosulfatarculus sandiegensis]|uniref:Cyclohexane-1-carbonyl-CoA dehydrogenase n=1 Tax=Dethiosulfatarculus sandiegensis TaxID=1429043 RepID=A0A0D2HMJ2_9BACT|nr:acyl-CoA dehydrogenase [Dethiosulfatarculus sandiegensis]KIX11823.1 acyl-CoA dehydrogenase [Dethiosulfatarculus sandiegensis]